MQKLLLAAAPPAVSTPPSSHPPGRPASTPAVPPPRAGPAAPAAAAPRPDADPALWMLRDSDTVIYLFGTFHLLDGRRDWFNDEVRAAFDRSGELAAALATPAPARGPRPTP